VRLSSDLQAASGSYAESRKLVRLLRSALTNDVDIVELRRRLQTNATTNQTCYLLPHDVLLTYEGFQIGVPRPFDPRRYLRHYPLSAKRLHEAGSAERVTAEIKQAAHAYVTSADYYDWGSAGPSDSQVVEEKVKSGARKVAQVLTSPIWGTAWLFRKVIQELSPRD